MSVKKLLLLGAAGLISVAATASLAGGPDIAPMPVNDTGVYIEGDLGYALVPWRDSFLNVFNDPGDSAVTVRNNANGGFTAGGAIGYQWSQYLAAEFGGFYLPQVQGNIIINDGGENSFGFQINSYFLYLAGKLMAPIPGMDNLKAFLKAGVAYRNVNFKGFDNSGMTFNNNNNGNVWGPVFALGLQYDINPNWYVNAQWMYVGDSTQINGFNGNSGNQVSIPVPAVNSFTAGIGVKFAV